MNMRIEINLIPHNELDDINLDKIVSLKMQHWNYKKEDQIKWIIENLEENDFHLMLKNKNDELIAYLNIVAVRISIGGSVALFSGIGNVCVNSKQSGKGYGILLMNICNLFIKEMERPGVLLCKETLVSFYKKAGWYKYNGNVLLNNKIFSDSVFFTKRTLSPAIEIEKSF